MQLLSDFKYLHPTEASYFLGYYIKYSSFGLLVFFLPKLTCTLAKESQSIIVSFNLSHEPHTEKIVGRLHFNFKYKFLTDLQWGGAHCLMQLSGQLTILLVG